MQSEPRKNFFSRFGLFRVRSPLLTESRLISLPRPTQMFQFRRFPSYTYFIQYMIYKLHLYGLLHSEIYGSKRTYRSPQLIAVNHVLHRLPMPRHSPCALISFTICFMFYEFSLKLLISQYIVVFYPIILSYRFKLVVSSFALLFSLFCFQASFSVPKNRFQQSTSIDHSNPFLGFGGHKWTRTIDLTLIRRAL